MGMMGQQRGGYVWLWTTHLASSSQADYVAGTEQGTGERRIPAHQAFIIQRRRKTIPQHPHHVPRRATPGGPLGTLIKLGKNTVACLLLRYVTDNVRKIQPSSTGQHILSHLSCTQRKWALDKENPCLMSSTEPWLTPNPGTWHPNKLNSVRTIGNGRGSLGQLTWSNLFTSLDSRLTIWPVVVFPMAKLLRRSDWNEKKIQRIGFLQWYQVSLRT